MDSELKFTENLNGLLQLFQDNETISQSVPFEVELAGSRLDVAGNITVEGSGLAARYSSSDLVINWKAHRFSHPPVWEFELEVGNLGTENLFLTRLDAASLALRGDVWKVESFNSAWGDEFRPVNGTTRHDSFFGVRSGRSSHGGSPLVYLIRESDGFTVIVSPAWSGNWHIDVFAGGWVRAGISTWNLNLELSPGEKLKAPSVIVSAAKNRYLAQKQLQVAVRDNWLARSKASDKIPVEWNHWWPYEDAEVNESVILENASIAENMAIDSIVVDAGWFGESKLDTHWTDLRGDWSSVNLARFPSGLKKLGEEIAAKGLVPGIWMEIEAVGANSRLRKELPEALARDDSGARPDPSFRVGTASLDASDPGFLGYICLGSEAGWNYALESLTKVVGEMQAHWLKVDFNIDPGFGCTRTDHGHKAGDGLFRHYQGLYRLLDVVRETFPELIVEACSSGGLRVDLGLAKHLHCFFLSDPDYTEHHLQVLYGSVQMLPPMAILHWPWSWWRNDYGPSQLNWSEVDPETFDVFVRSNILHRLGVSYPLPKLAPRLLERLTHHLEIFRHKIAPILSNATLASLTESPIRGGTGERNPVWQLSSGVGTDQEVHIVVSVLLESTAKPSAAKLVEILPKVAYRISDLETKNEIEAFGESISKNLLSEFTGNTRSWIIEIRPKGTT